MCCKFGASSAAVHREDLPTHHALLLYTPRVCSRSGRCSPNDPVKSQHSRKKNNGRDDKNNSDHRMPVSQDRKGGAIEICRLWVVGRYSSSGWKIQDIYVDKNYSNSRQRAATTNIIFIFHPCCSIYYDGGKKTAWRILVDDSYNLLLWLQRMPVSQDSKGGALRKKTAGWLLADFLVPVGIHSGCYIRVLWTTTRSNEQQRRQHLSKETR